MRIIGGCMPTKKQLEDEILSLRGQLYQARQDYRNDMHHLKDTEWMKARESMCVRMVLMECDAGFEALTIVRFENSRDGVNVIVANTKAGRKAV